MLEELVSAAQTSAGTMLHMCALLFTPSFEDNVRVAGDIGMDAQTLLLYPGGRLHRRRVGCTPVPCAFSWSSLKIKSCYSGSSSATREASRSNNYRMDRAALSDFVLFHASLEMT
jgi:hypothetical protein